ncbi:MAG: hypothetical protein K1X67_24085 [Fimbriimonadaceae bacterium]|nr:hypothetical protein [Fimbriimonadaceae bacterium]
MPDIINAINNNHWSAISLVAFVSFLAFMLGYSIVKRIPPKHWVLVLYPLKPKEVDAQHFIQHARLRLVAFIILVGIIGSLTAFAMSISSSATHDAVAKKLGLVRGLMMARVLETDESSDHFTGAADTIERLHREMPDAATSEILGRLLDALVARYSGKPTDVVHSLAPGTCRRFHVFRPDIAALPYWLVGDAYIALGRPDRAYEAFKGAHAVWPLSVEVRLRMYQTQASADAKGIPPLGADRALGNLDDLIREIRQSKMPGRDEILVRALISRAELALTMSSGQAENSCAEAIRIAKSIDQSPSGRRWLGLGHFLIARIRFAEGKHAEAARGCTEALDAWGFTPDSNDDLRLPVGLALIYRGLCTIEVSASSAEHDFRAGHRILGRFVPETWQVVNDLTNWPQYRYSLVDSLLIRDTLAIRRAFCLGLGDRGRALILQGNTPDAVLYLRCALEATNDLMALGEMPSQTDSFRARVQFMLGSALASQGQDEGGDLLIASAEAYLKLPKDEAKREARDYSLAMVAASRISELRGKQDERVAWRNRALKALSAWPFEGSEAVREQAMRSIKAQVPVSRHRRFRA